MRKNSERIADIAALLSVGVVLVAMVVMSRLPGPAPTPPMVAPTVVLDGVVVTPRRSLQQREWLAAQHAQARIARQELNRSADPSGCALPARLSRCDTAPPT